MPKPGAKKDNELAVLQRRKEVARMYLEGKSQWEISQVVGVSQPMVSVDLQWVRDQWLKSVLKDYDEKVARELAALDYQEAQLWEAWHRSCGVEVVKTRSVERELRTPTEEVEEEVSEQVKSKKGRKPLAAMIPVSVTNKKVSKQLIGNPIFMSEIRAIRELRCKILGVVKKEETDKQQVNINLLPPEFWQQAQGVRTEVNSVDQKLKELDELPALPQAPKPDEMSKPPPPKPSENGHVP